ncbi:heme o synthase [Parvicella tangerina]|uniref:Protoheme IX farnesyltransferase n=1 Tax=Parvicella tangerina TaxID=2829795 RepID=A0A916NFH2_9FLAO|nr:heme o synthase [Parvicella tangerina]CAG5077825.1 Protoheme IX farnesyltransferase [Parvicella tangerina]
MAENTEIISSKVKQYSKVQDFVALGKLRLASLVVFSAALGYLIALPSIAHFDWVSFGALVIGGFLVTAASNAFNQVWERNLDVKMDRTKDRPVAAGRLSAKEAVLFAVFSGVLGEVMLFMLNPLSGALGLLAMVMYVLLYTPLKTVSPIAVFVGAFPGSIPPMLGYIAVTGEFGWFPGVLFLTQFFWQFPHFWAIAWNIHDDYLKAGFRLLPSKGGRTKGSAFQIFIYSAALIPIGILPCIQLTPEMEPMCSSYAVFVLIPLGLMKTIPAMRLYQTLNKKYAKQLMFASFIYLPVAQLAYYFFKL